LGAIRSAAQMVSYEVSIGLILMNILVVVGSLNIRIIVDFQEHIWFIIPFSPLFLLFFISALAETNRAPFDLPEAEGELVAGFNVEYSATSFALFFIGEYVNIFFMATLSALLFFGGWNMPNIYFFSPLIFPVLFDFISLLNNHALFYAHQMTAPLSLIDSLLLTRAISIYLFDTAIIYYFTAFLMYKILLILQTFVFVIKVNIIVFFFLLVRASVPRFRYDTLMRLTWKVFLPLSLGFLILNISIKML